MIDEDEDYRTMVVGVDRLLTEERPAWEAIYPNMVPAYDAVHQAMNGLSGVRQKLTGTGGGGSADAKEKAEEAALDAAMKVIKGLRTVREGLKGDVPPELVRATQWQRSELDDLRDTELVDTLQGIRTVAKPYEAALVGERVTAAHLLKLEDTTEAYGKLVGAPRGEIVDAAALRKQERKHIADLRNDLIPKLDARMDNLEEDMPELVARYRQLRIIVNTSGGGGKKGEAQA